MQLNAPITVLVTGVRHRITAWSTDQRIVWTACGQRIAVGSYDPTSVYQRTVYPAMQRPMRCPSC